MQRLILGSSLALVAALGTSTVGLARSEVSVPATRAAKVVYAVSQGGRVRALDYDLCVMSPDGSGRRRLTSGPGWDTNPQLSPDGRRIAFEYSWRNGDAYDGRIHVMTIDGGNRVNLTPRSETFGNDHEPAWSPDGTKIVFSGWAARGDAPYEIRVMNADGSRRRSLGYGRSPDWSPDGSKIVFALAGFMRGIFVMNADGTGRTRLTESGEAPVWSPDGTRIAFSDREQQGEAHIFVLRADGSGRRALTGASRSDTNPTWSPDGSKVMFVRGGDFGDIYVVEADGSGEANLTRSPRGESNPHWGEGVVARIGGQGCAPSIVGTGNADALSGTPGGDAIYGLGGADRIDAKGGTDLVSGGRGDDRLVIRDGARDSAACGQGRDTVLGDRLDEVGRSCERVRRR